MLSIRFIMSLWKNRQLVIQQKASLDHFRQMLARSEKNVPFIR